MTLAENNRLSCSKKARFADEASASAAYFASLPKKVQRNARWKRKCQQQKQINTLNLYICSHCGYMHLGHLNPYVVQLKAMAATR